MIIENVLFAGKCFAADSADYRRFFLCVRCEIFVASAAVNFIIQLPV